MGFIPFALRPLLIANCVFLVIGLPFLLGFLPWSLAIFFVVLRLVDLGARPSLTSSP